MDQWLHCGFTNNCCMTAAQRGCTEGISVQCSLVSVFSLIRAANHNTMVANILFDIILNRFL